MKKVMVVIGHDFNSKGCYNEKLNVHEYDFCMKVATTLFAEEVWDDIDLLLKSRNRFYKDLADEINSSNPDYVVELHLNSVDNKKVQGTEHLYCYGSERGKKIADIFQKHCVKEFGFRDRGLNGIVKGENGYPILSKTKAPCIIAEPFFLSDENIKSEDLEELTRKYIMYLKRAIREMCNRGI